MGQDHEIIFFLWSCDPVLQDHKNTWSHGFDLRFFMISWFWSWRFHDPGPKNPWSGDLTHRIFMIRWSHSTKFHDPVIFELFLVINLVFNSDPNFHWLIAYASMILCTVVINRNSLFPSLRPNFRFSTFGVPKNALGTRAFFFRNSSHPWVKSSSRI